MFQTISLQKKWLNCLQFAFLLFSASLTASPSFPNISQQPLQLASVKAAIFDMESQSLLYEKNAEVPTPIASITKMMTAMVILDAGQPLSEWLTIKKITRDSTKNAYSHFRIGSQLQRGELLKLSLMASENLAASTLAHNYPGGFDAFVAAMNAKAVSLGMNNSQFADATGLSIHNVSTASDLVLMVAAAMGYEKIREFSTTTYARPRFKNPRYHLTYGNTNRLLQRSSWDVLVSKTGYLTEAGRCLLFVTEIDDKPVAMALLDSFGKLTPIGDAGRVKRWLRGVSSSAPAGAARNYEQQKAAQLK